MYLLITNPFDIYYLTGFLADNLLERQSYVLCRLASTRLPNTTAPQPPGQLKDIQEIWHMLPEMFAASCSETPSERVERVVLTPGTKLGGQLSQLVARDNGSKLPQVVHFQPEDMRYAEFTALELNRGIKLMPMPGMLTQMRVCKSETETEKIRIAAQRSEAVYQEILKLLKPGITELALSKAVLEELSRPDRPGFASAFDPIVAFGQNSAIPHHRATSKALAPGDIVLVDMGASYLGYCSDICRTSIFDPTAAQQKLFTERLGRVEKSLQVAAEYFGRRARRLDTLDGQELAGRSVQTSRSAHHDALPTLNTTELSDLMQQALGKQYPLFHAFGHGLGLQVHEGPHISNLGKPHGFKGGEVIALEPGLYIPGWGGIRIEYNYHIG